jgi:hypothetical protein
MFGKRDDKLRQQRRTISRVQRETERERQRLQQEEEKIKAEIRSLAKKASICILCCTFINIYLDLRLGTKGSHWNVGQVTCPQPTATR